MKALFNYDERTNYSNICLRFRPVAVILSFGRVQTIKYTQNVKMASYESIHLNIVYVLSGPEQLGVNPMCVNILS